MPTPRGVKQNKNWGCWAACMESWTEQVALWKTVTQEAIAKKYGGAEDSLNTAGPEFGKFCEEYGFNIVHYSAGAIDASALTEMLNPPYHFCMVIEKLAQGSHARLIHGVRRDVNGNAVLKIMEPRIGQLDSLNASAIGRAMLLSPLA